MSEKSASVSSSGTTTDGPRTYQSAWQWNENQTSKLMTAEEWLIEEADVDATMSKGDEDDDGINRGGIMRAIAAEIVTLRRERTQWAEECTRRASITSSQTDSSLRAAERSSPTVTPPQTPTYLAELRDFAQRAYVLLANMTDDEECERDRHGNCQTHGLERDCSNARSRVLLDEYTELFDELFSEVDSGAASPPVTEEAPNEDTARLDWLEADNLRVAEVFHACELTEEPRMLRHVVDAQIRAARSTPTEEKSNAE